MEQLESGDQAKISGFYVSNHQECRAENLWVRRDGLLPVCAQCGMSATFRLRKEMEHISDDPDFKQWGPRS